MPLATVPGERLHNGYILSQLGYPSFFPVRRARACQAGIRAPLNLFHALAVGVSRIP